MTLPQTQKFAQQIFRLLKVREVIFPIARTSQGNFGIKFTPDNNEYEMYLDAVPLPVKDMLKDENNIELKKIVEKYLFEQIPLVVVGNKVHAVSSLGEMKLDTVSSQKPKRGRPVGSKNADTKTKKSS